jgi:hypothetical protein
MFEWLRRIVLESIEETGRVEGAPIVNFPERIISVEGEDMYVGQKLLERFLDVSAFYLALPPNTAGVVVYPDGTSYELEGKLYKVPIGVYSIHYVDKRERTDLSGPVSEITTDNEKLTLQVILRYHVKDPVLALSIVHPIATLMEHIETDVAQYIRTHNHNEIADTADNTHSRLFAFFSERHERRKPLSDAISITGIELKEFAGDKEYVEMRRKVRIDETQSELNKQLEKHQQEISRLKSEFKAEIGKMEAMHENEKKEIMHQAELREIELEDRRNHLQRRENEFFKAIDAISLAISSSAYPTNSNVIKIMTDLVSALKEDVGTETYAGAEAVPTENKSATGESRTTPTGSDRVEKLTNTLLNLLNPKR